MMNEEIISEEMAKARDNHTQQRYNHESHANTKPSDDITCRQIGCRQGTHQCSFQGTGSSYASEITKTIPNLHTGMSVPNQRMTRHAPVNLKSHSPAHTVPTISSTCIGPKTAVTYKH
ncbi:hypothetical protein Fot_42285 [Forsythia ovata]|uniref:Uncharacterized protein n=1 Tax=Forsythia ovata TaxID=205694 RepID=A0ABD1RMJ4_9LAMI